MIQFSSNIGFIRTSQVEEKIYPYDTESWTNPTNIKLIQQPAEVWIHVDENDMPISADLNIYARKGLRGFESKGKEDLATNHINLNLDDALNLNYQNFSEGEEGQGFKSLEGVASYNEEDDSISFESEGGSLVVPNGKQLKGSFILKDMDKSDPEYVSENSPDNEFEITDQNVKDENFFDKENVKDQNLSRLDHIRSKVEDVKASISTAFESIRKVPRNYFEVLGIDKYIDELLDTKNMNALEYWFTRMTGEDKVRVSPVLASNKKAQLFNKIFNKKLMNEVKNEIGYNLSETYRACLVLSDMIGGLSRDDIAVMMSDRKTKEAIENVRGIANRYMSIIKKIEGKIGGELSYAAGSWKKVVLSEIKK